MIRSAGAGDLPQLASFYHSMLDELGMLHDPLVAQWERIFEEHHRQLLAEGSEAWFVAMAEGTPVGSACAVMDTSASAKMSSVRSGVIVGVYVKPESRRRGLARALTQACLQWFRDNQVKRVRLQASPYARPLYESLGFKPGIEMRLNLD